jgi:hypothetical protein
MENAPILLVSGSQLAEGTDPDLSARYQGWVEESYTPLRASLPGSLGADRYQIVNPRPEYPFSLLNYHIENTELALQSLNHPDRIALLKDMKTWIDRGILQFFWGCYYELIKSFRNEGGQVVIRQGTMVEAAPFLHLEGYRMSSEDQDKYMKWLNEWGFKVLIPLITKLPGLKAFNCYNDPDLKAARSIFATREYEYPHFITVLYFENQQSFDNYTRSAERLAFQKAIGNIFPNGLNYKWYVQYQLTRSWRK